MNRKEHQVVDGVEQKHCSKCGTFKALDCFAKCTGAWDDKQGYCRECAAVAWRVALEKRTLRARAAAAK